MEEGRSKKARFLLLTTAMIIIIFSQLSTNVHAAEMPDTIFATKEQLTTFNTDDQDKKNPAKVYFGNSSQQWWIAGSQSENNLILFAASPLVDNQPFEPQRNYNKTYLTEWNCTYLNDASIMSVYPNHYGASPLRTTLKSLETSYFTDGERTLMNDTTVYTNDAKNNNIYSTTNKLYLAYGDLDNLYITVGENKPDNLNNGLHVDMAYWGNSSLYGRGLWLRAPNKDWSFYGLEAYLSRSGSDGNIGLGIVDGHGALVPAFEMNLSSVLFASAAQAALSDGELDVKDAGGDGAFTLRYSTDTLGSAKISDNKTNVTIENAPFGTYLVAQNSTGAWAKAVNGNTSVSASELDNGLTSFENCRVWLEKTDAVSRMISATMATEGYSVEVTENTGVNIISNNNTQVVLPGTAIEDIKIEVEQGYYLPDDYMSHFLGLNGLSVTKTDTGFTISGMPTGNITLSLPAATEKKNRIDQPNVTGGIGSTINGTDITMEYALSDTSDTWTNCTADKTETGAGTWYVRYKATETTKAGPAVQVMVIAPVYTISADESSLVFEPQNEEYSVNSLSRTVTITNTGNSPVTLELPSSQNYNVTLSETIVAPNGTAILTVTPKSDLPSGNYEEIIVVRTTQSTSVNVSVSFTVNGAFSVVLSKSADSLVEGGFITLTATPAGGSGNYTYEWYANNILETSLVGNKVIVSPTETTTYKVIVTDTIENQKSIATITIILGNYDLEVPNDLTFDKQHVGYTDVFANGLIIKNIGDVNVAGIYVVLTGTNADSFTLDTTGMKVLLTPNESTTFFVKPNTGLPAGTYTAELNIMGEVNIRKTVVIHFMVEDHNYEEFVTQPTCTKKGYTTHTCKFCGVSYTDSETDMISHDFKHYISDENATCTKDGTKTAKCANCDATDTKTDTGSAGHIFGEWEVVKEATTTDKGERVRKCSRCGAEERESIPMITNIPDKNSDSGTDRTKLGDKVYRSVETGDKTNLQCGVLMVASGLGIAVLLRLKHKRIYKTYNDR